MRVFQLLVGLTVLGLASAGNAFACSCEPSGPPCPGGVQS